jgi:hypothetical protein
MTDKNDDTGPGEAAAAAESGTPAEAAPEVGETAAAEPEQQPEPEQDWPEPEDDGPEFDPRLDTLCGDLRDVMLSRVRTARKPWEKMSEAEQTDFANGLQLAASDMVRRMVRLLTSFEYPHAAVTLGEVKIKGEKGIEAKITCPNAEHNRSVLGEHVGDHVMLLMVDSDTFMGERRPVKIRPDQPQLDLEDGAGIPDPAPAQAELPIEEPAEAEAEADAEVGDDTQVEPDPADAEPQVEF